MKAIRVHEFGGPEVLRVEEVPDVQPGPRQVIVRIHAAGVNPLDLHVRAGGSPRTPPLPYTPGTDGAGTVESVGKEVTRLHPGDRVYVAGCLSGTYAEKALCDESTVRPLPQHNSFAQGAAVNIPYATAHRSLFHHAQAKPGETVLINGASGSVGIASVQFARAGGLYVVGIAGSDRGSRLVLEQGAHQAIDHNVPDHFDKALALSAGRGYDVIIEMLANRNLGRDLTILAPRGRVVLVGSRGTAEFNPVEAMLRDATILGIALWNATVDELRAIHAAIGAGLENKTLRPVVNKEFPLAEAPRAHADITAPGAYGKIVLIP